MLLQVQHSKQESEIIGFKHTTFYSRTVPDILISYNSLLSSRTLYRISSLQKTASCFEMKILCLPSFFIFLILLLFNHMHFIFLQNFLNKPNHYIS